MRGKVGEVSKERIARRGTGGRRSKRKAGRRSRTRSSRDYRHLAENLNLVGLPRRRAGALQWGKAPGAVLLITATVLLVCFFVHPAFRVRAVSVSGQRLAEAGQIVAASGVEGRSIFHLNPAGSAGRIPTECPSIERAVVTSMLPNKVSIEVEERRIATVWETRGESYLVDESGLILVRGAIVGRSVRINDSDNTERLPGDRVPSEVLSMVWSLNRMAPDLDAFTYSDAHGVSVVMAQGWPVYFGTKGDPSFKLRLLEALQKDFYARGVHPQYVDLRLDDRPAYR